MRLQHLYLASHPEIATINSMQLFETDAAFHEMCAESSGNAFFVQAIQSQNRLRRLLEFGSYFNSRRVQEWCREHSQSSRRLLPVISRRLLFVCAATSNRR